MVGTREQRILKTEEAQKKQEEDGGREVQGEGTKKRD